MMETLKEKIAKLSYDGENLRRAIGYLQKCTHNDVGHIISQLSELRLNYLATEHGLRNELLELQDKCQHESYSVCGHEYCIKCGKLLEEF